MSAFDPKRTSVVVGVIATSARFCLNFVTVPIRAFDLDQIQGHRGLTILMNGPPAN